VRGSRDRLTAPAAVAAICPYLVASDAESRAAAPSRDHRCGAVEPPARLPLEQQSRLCLTAGHLECPSYVAATSPMAVHPLVATARPMPQTVPTVLDRANPLANLSRLGAGGVHAPSLTARATQGVLAGILVVALALVLVTRFNEGHSGASGPGPSAFHPAATAAPGSSAVGGVVPSPSPSLAPSGGPGASATASISQGPSVAPSPSPTRKPTSYRVKAGDTLSSIAARFGTTVAKLMELNHITDPKTLHVGQLLKLR
jgi:LysM repeat protein